MNLRTGIIVRPLLELKKYISDVIDELKDKISMSSISLDECKIWIETTEDRITYAKTATSVIPVDTVAITGISEPVPMQELDTVVDNYSSEISDASIIWTCNGVEVKGDAEYSTSYIANITITLKDEYGFFLRCQQQSMVKLVMLK